MEGGLLTDCALATEALIPAEGGLVAFAVANPVTAGLVLAGGVIVASCIVGGICYYFGKQSASKAAKTMPPAARPLTKAEAIDILTKVMDRFSSQMDEFMREAKAAKTEDEKQAWMERWDKLEENLTRATRCYDHFLDE